jgi:serine/threonine protein kinase
LRIVKLCDFGLSLSRTKIQKKNTGFLGDPAWMAPEVLRGENYQEASDVYSFGMVLWLDY